MTSTSLMISVPSAAAAAAAAATASAASLRHSIVCPPQRRAEGRFSFCTNGRTGHSVFKILHVELDQSNSKQVVNSNRGKRPPGTCWLSYSGERKASSKPASATPNGKSLEDVKKAVMRSVSNTNRGKNTTSEQRQGILKVIEELEALNPAKDPVNSPLFSGRWALLYTAPIDETTADKYAGTEEGPFLARVKPAAFGKVKQSRSVQVIDSSAGVAENIAYFNVFANDGNLNIRGSVKQAPPKPEGAVRVNVTFESFVLTLGGWSSPTVSLGWIRPEGWVDTTFLDKDMRVGRGDKGSIFVSVRMKEGETIEA